MNYRFLTRYTKYYLLSLVSKGIVNAGDDKFGNNDFILGRVYQWIVHEVYDDMREKFPKSTDLRNSLATQNF